MIGKVKKPHLRSFRYSDAVAEILESMPGDSLNEKFEKLVLTCYQELPAVKEQLDRYQELIARERKEYLRLRDEKWRIVKCLRLMDDLETYLSGVTQIVCSCGADRD